MSDKWENLRTVIGPGNDLEVVVEFLTMEVEDQEKERDRLRKECLHKEAALADLNAGCLRMAVTTCQSIHDLLAERDELAGEVERLRAVVAAAAEYGRELANLTNGGEW